MLSYRSIQTRNAQDGLEYGAMQVLMYSAPWCRDCRATKRYLDTHGIAFTEIDIEADPAASDEVVRHVGKRRFRNWCWMASGFSRISRGAGFCMTSSMRFGIKTRL
jgi:hypothetical protein